MSSESMPTWMKFVLGIVGLMCVLGVLAGIAIWWAMAKLETTFAGFEEELPAVAQQGVDFGQSHDQDACVDEGLSQALLCTPVDIPCIVKSAVFGNACLEAAVPDPTLCGDVPPDNPFALSTWAQEECARRGHADNAMCVQYIQQSLATYCLTQASR